MSGWGLQTYSVKDQTINILDFVDPVASVTTTQLCQCSKKVATDNG